MSSVVRTLAPEDTARLGALLQHASLVREFENLQGPHGLADLLAEPFIPAELRWIAEADGEPAGFAFTFLLQGLEGKWSMTRIGILESARRRGLGSALLETARHAIRERAPDCREICLGAWLPNGAAESFAARHGFRRVRSYWLMERPEAARPTIAWPPAIETRLFDGSERAIADWSETYNRSFARHYHFAVGTVDDIRALAARSSFEPTGHLLAYRDDRCVGFCGNEFHGERGEIGILGTDPEARGIGLGRALLRWGVNWLLDHRAPRVTLMVDGENESALRLYRSEGFEVKDTRAIWAIEES